MHRHQASRRVHLALGLALAAILAAGPALGDPSVWVKIGGAKQLIHQNRVAEAQKILQGLVDRTDELPAEAYYQLAVCHARQGGAQAADRTLELALARDPEYLPALHLRAYFLFASGRYQEALEWTSRYLQKSPGGGETRKISGLAHFMLGNKIAAERDLKRAADLLAEDFEAQYFLGRVYFERSKLMPALGSFRRALALNPESVKAHNHLGQTLEGLTRFEEAKIAYHRAIDLEGKSAARSEWPYYNLGSLLLSEGDAARAVALLEQALERNPSSVQIQTKLGVALSAAARFDEAAQRLEAAVRAEPRNANAHYQLGRVFMKLGKVDEAREHLSRFERFRER